MNHNLLLEDDVLDGHTKHNQNLFHDEAEADPKTERREGDQLSLPPPLMPQILCLTSYSR